MNIDFPFHFDVAGHTATTTWQDHVRDLLIQFLFTAPGQRVNRPDFGVGLLALCFEGNSQGLAEVVQFIARAGLQRWLGSAIEVMALEVVPDDATLSVNLTYRILGEDQPRQVNVSQRGLQ